VGVEGCGYEVRKKACKNQENSRNRAQPSQGLGQMRGRRQGWEIWNLQTTLI